MTDPHPLPDQIMAWLLLHTVTRLLVRAGGTIPSTIKQAWR